MPHAARVAEAFALNQPTSQLQPIQYTGHQTWRLDTCAGSYLVKRLADPGVEPDRPDLERAMALEQKAIRAGIRTATPVAPVNADIGLAATVDGLGCVRVYEWLPHRKLAAAGDISTWLGSTLARLHELEPVERPAEPDWPDLGVWPELTWKEWVRQAEQLDKPWAAVARQRITTVVALTERLRETYASPPDQVITHLDLEPHNVLLSDCGPVLVDWETVRPYSAALQAGRVSLAFGSGKLDRMRNILRAYTAAGGRVEWPGERLLSSTLSHELATIGARVQAALGVRPAPRWLDVATADQRIGTQLHDLPSLVDHLTELAKCATTQCDGRIWTGRPGTLDRGCHSRG